MVKVHFILILFWAAGVFINVRADISSPQSEVCDAYQLVNNPLEEIVPQCMALRQKTFNPTDLIFQDLKVCKCLEEKNFIFPDALSTMISKENDASDKLRVFSKSQANNIALSSISNSTTPRNLEVRLLTGITETRGRVKETNKESTLSKLPPRLRESALPLMSTTLEHVNSIPAERENNQCVTYMEYSAQRELPYDNDFFTFIGKTTAFVEDDWKIESLKNAYDIAPENQKNEIMARMSFLSRNPQYAALFRAQSIEGITPSELLTMKEELFGIMRVLSPVESLNCHATENLCWRQAQASGAYKQFSENAERFLLQNKVIDIVSAQTSVDYMAEVLRLNSTKKIPTTETGYSNYLQSEHQDIAFGCYGPSSKADCNTIFAEHCKQIRKFGTKNNKSNAITGPEIVEELSAAQQLHGQLDPTQNLSFASFNDLICLQNYRNSSGEESNFFTFKNKLCNAPGSPQECSDRRSLLAKFLREYNVSSSKADENIRAGFAEALTRPNFLNVTEMQINAVNRIAESPRQLRERFNGEYPAINQSGQLRNFLPTPSRPISRTSDLPSKMTDMASAEAVNSQQSFSRREEMASLDQRAIADRRPAQDDPKSVNNVSPDLQPDQQFRPALNQLVPAENLFSPIPTGPVERLASPETNRVNRTQLPKREPGLSDQNTMTETSSVFGAATSRPSTVVQRSPGKDAMGIQALNDSKSMSAGPQKKSRPSKENMNLALLGIYENVVVNSVSNAQEELINRKGLPVKIDSDLMSSVINDPTILAGQESVVLAVNSSSDSVVKLSLEAEGRGPVIVYAIKVNDQIAFTLTPPSLEQRPSQALTGKNEMHFQLKPNAYLKIRNNPADLGKFEEIMRPAMSLPGNIIRVNLKNDEQKEFIVYIDKRGPAPVFTSDDPRIIDAYRP
jgi:hypothetical protein